MWPWQSTWRMSTRWPTSSWLLESPRVLLTGSWKGHWMVWTGRSGSIMLALTRTAGSCMVWSRGRGSQLTRRTTRSSAPHTTAVSSLWRLARSQYLWWMRDLENRDPPGLWWSSPRRGWSDSGSRVCRCWRRISWSSVMSSILSTPPWPGNISTRSRTSVLEDSVLAMVMLQIVQSVLLETISVAANTTHAENFVIGKL